ncbi:MAG TPA: acetylornithine transaminase [Desulfobacteraceae bacterium]|nr:acetylornithine transaminase [Desulfobacteraceae bacterium]
MNTLEKTDHYILNTYPRQQTVFVKGQGATLWDDRGNAYTDFLAGIAVTGLGHCHPGVVRAMAEQAEKLIHVSNLYYTEPQAELAELLVQKSFADKVFFANSGAEANEAAIKLARRYFREKNDTGRFKIITMDKSFHGRTMATLSATGQEKIKQGFSPLVEGFHHVPFNDIEALKSRMDGSVCAVMLEPVQGEGGVVPADPDYLKQVRQLCSEEGCLLIFDEVQTGMGRCGELFAHEHYGVVPDIMTLAKALGNGLPIGAMLASDDAATGFAMGSHGTTFGGTPFVAAAALEVVKTVSDPSFLTAVREKADYFAHRLNGLKERHSSVRQVRGVGLLLGLELDAKQPDIVLECMKKGFIINLIQDKIIRFAPPLVITKEEIDGLVKALDALL